MENDKRKSRILDDFFFILVMRDIIKSKTYEKMIPKKETPKDGKR